MPLEGSRVCVSRCSPALAPSRVERRFPTFMGLGLRPTSKMSQQSAENLEVGPSNIEVSLGRSCFSLLLFFFFFFFFSYFFLFFFSRSHVTIKDSPRSPLALKAPSKVDLTYPVYGPCAVRPSLTFRCFLAVRPRVAQARFARSPRPRGLCPRPKMTAVFSL